MNINGNVLEIIFTNVQETFLKSFSRTFMKSFFLTTLAFHKNQDNRSSSMSR